MSALLIFSFLGFLCIGVPVAVALRDNNEAWVVNHLSDDISIVDLRTMHVRATLRVGDKVQIAPSGWGKSYRLTVDGRSGFIQVERIDKK